MTLGRRKVVEVFLGEDQTGHRLLERIFRLPLRDCMVQVRQRRAGDTCRPVVLVDGQPLTSEEEDGRLSTRVLRQAVLTEDDAN